jgi:hypothetical protein
LYSIIYTASLIRELRWTSRKWFFNFKLWKSLIDCHRPDCSSCHTDMFKRSGKEHLYTALAELPVPTSAFFQNSGHDGVLDHSRLAFAFVAQTTCKVIRVTFSKQDHERNVTRSISKTIFVTSPNTLSSTLAQDASDIQVIHCFTLKVSSCHSTSNIGPG